MHERQQRLSTDKGTYRGNISAWIRLKKDVDGILPTSFIMPQKLPYNSDATALVQAWHTMLASRRCGRRSVTFLQESGDMVGSHAASVTVSGPLLPSPQHI